ncbi:TPA: hypothetical protein R8G79_003085 [Citrobacter amalonaticus]|nr:hypothetical protein [Citrobacter amalonaticus]
MKKSAYNEAKTAGVLTKQFAKTFIAKAYPRPQLNRHLATALCAEADMSALMMLRIH